VHNLLRVREAVTSLTGDASAGGVGEGEDGRTGGEEVGGDGVISGSFEFYG
jgi:hypothetical protein